MFKSNYEFIPNIFEWKWWLSHGHVPAQLCRIENPIRNFLRKPASFRSLFTELKHNPKNCERLISMVKQDHYSTIYVSKCWWNAPAQRSYFSLSADYNYVESVSVPAVKIWTAIQHTSKNKWTLQRSCLICGKFNNEFREGLLGIFRAPASSVLM